MIGVSSTDIIDSLAFGCVIPLRVEYTGGCRAAVREMRQLGLLASEEDERREREKCFNRVRYTFSIIRSTRLVFEGENLVYLVPCIMYFRTRYERNWVNAFKHRVKMLVEPNYSKPLTVDEAELKRALRYSRKIPGYKHMNTITGQLARVNKNLTSIMTLLESVTLNDGTKIHLRDHLSNIIKEVLNEDDDIDRIKHRLDFKTGMVLGTSLSRTKFLLELLIALITVASFSKRPQYKPTPRIYIRVLKANQNYYDEKLNKIKERHQKGNENIPLELLNPSYYIRKKISEELESILDTVSKLFENTRQYINTYYSADKAGKNTRSAANRLLTEFISGRLLLSLDSVRILSEIVGDLLLSRVSE
jgi:hypothetical protein